MGRPKKHLDGKNPTKRDRFVRIAEERTQRVLDDLQSLKKCASRESYEYSTEDAHKIISAIESELSSVKDSFAGRKQFSLQDHTVSAAESQASQTISTSEILLEILNLARSDLNQNGFVGYAMPNSEYYIYIYVDDSISHVKDNTTPDDYFYAINPSVVGNDDIIALGPEYSADYNDFSELMIGCMRCIEYFEVDKERSMNRESTLSSKGDLLNIEQKPSLKHLIQDADSRTINSRDGSVLSLEKSDHSL